MLKKILKGLMDSLKFKTLNPLCFQLAAAKPLSKVTNDYLVAKLKHEAHLLDKNIKNPYKAKHGLERKMYVSKLLKECKTRELDQPRILKWAEHVLAQYERWLEYQEPIVQFGQLELNNENIFSVPSVRFWSKDKPEKKLIYQCIETAQLAPASCNRQAFKVVVVENSLPKTNESSALNSSMFAAAAYRVFIYYNRSNYTEKFSAAIDVGMFSQNFILEAKRIGLGCCCCYASEHLDKPQNEYRQKFNLEKEYYCLLTILVGTPNEIVSKPPRATVDSLVKFYKN
ncbi:nitroreductase family protein [Colwellia sp. Arc7-635]|uniref:nitroreductase family protein n=1 Tax=Colwellia sp. Arc7-635 TaxID=2497879 RepID=UPI000F850604|nr:nitroreductase family protein [Colwellia sp. Arc7-635]AZQ85456.1 nitroreductase family protein [Colwellia sp. Arc7-635]